MSAGDKRREKRRGSASPPPGRPKAERPLAGLAILTAAAFLLRAAHVLASRANPFFHNLPVDSSAYDQWGQRIAAGQWIGHGVFYQDPLYPYFLGVFYALIGRHLTALLLLQSALGAANVLLLREIARRLWDRRVGNVAAVLAALYAPFWFYDGLVLKTFLEVLLLNASLLALIAAAQAATRPESMRRGLLSGILLGFGSLARANYLLLAPLMLGWLLHPASRAPAPRVAAGEAPPGSEGSARARAEARGPGFGRWWREIPARTLAAGVCLAAGMLLVLLPVLIRNRAVGGDWVLTTAQGGQNFYMGNNPENARGVYSALSFVRPDPAHEQEDFQREAERRSGRSLSPSEASRFWMNRGLLWIAQNPGRALSLDLRKLGLFLHRYEEPDNEDIDFWGRYSPWLRYNPLRFGLIAPIALVGLVLGWPLRRRLSLLYIVLAAYTLSVSLFFILARYRLPAVSLLLVFAAGALVALYDAWRERRRKILLTAAAALVPALLIVHHPSAEESGPMSPGMYTNLGNAYLNDGRVEEALAAQREAVRLAPQWADARYNLAIALYRSGKRDEALDEFREVIRLNPDFAEAWSYLGNLLEEENRLDDSADALRRALRLQPQRAEHLYNLARVLGELHRTQETDSLLRALYGLRDSQYSVEGKLIEAKLLAEMGDKSRAAAILREYLAERPQSPMRPQLEAFLRARQEEEPKPSVPPSPR